MVYGGDITTREELVKGVYKARKLITGWPHLGTKPPKKYEFVRAP